MLRSYDLLKFLFFYCFILLLYTISESFIILALVEHIQLIGGVGHGMPPMYRVPQKGPCKVGLIMHATGTNMFRSHHLLATKVCVKFNSDPTSTFEEKAEQMKGGAKI